MGKLPSAKEYEPDCKHSEDRQESELCAQWGAVAAARRGNDLAADANRAARDANAIGAQTLLWTKIGFGAVLSTLLATAWAAWAASRAAGIADKSMSLFRDAEGGILAPRIEITHGGAAYTVALPNRGRSPVSVIHADVSVMDEEPKGPIPTFVHQFPVDLMIAEGKAYEFGEYQFETNARYVYFVGGCIYKTFFWETRLCRIAARVDRETGAKEVLHTVNFSKWDRMIHAIRPVRWWQFWRRPS
ncbi:MAG: hypothetical protein JWR80_8553 [Bradyrhizobium sp.]|nr:hypothetical protein [Bradyrhizobium sp.]